MFFSSWGGYSLSLTLYPSYTLSLFRFENGIYMKYLGVCGGLKITESSYDVKVLSNECVLDYLNVIDYVDPKFTDLYYYLVFQWRGVGLSTASKD